MANLGIILALFFTLYQFVIPKVFKICIYIVCKIIKRLYVVQPAAARNVLKNGKYKGALLKPNEYDAIIVGAGPAGGCAAFFMAQAGLKVALLERKQFPRDKYCGNAVVVPGLRILEEMNLLKVFEENGEVLYPDTGGFITPSGLSYFGKSVLEVGEPLTGGIKRKDLDMRIAYRAKEIGAKMFENEEVENAVFSKEQGMWTITTASKQEYVGRMLLCADGATSNLATKLGYVKEPPKGISTRAYVKAGTHCGEMDGVVVYPPFSLPGYCAVFKHPGNELNFCYYLIPCGDKLGEVSEKDLPTLHNYALTKDPFVSRIMGPNATVEPMRVAPLRCGLQGVSRTYGNHFMIIGDAAGFIDPLTGEGIHNAMVSGRDAAKTVINMKEEGDYSETSAAQYEDFWMASFGYDFPLSSAAAFVIWKFPIVLDACCQEMEARGNALFAKWARVMTMLDSKDNLLETEFVSQITVAIVKFYLKKHVLGVFYKGFFNYKGNQKGPFEPVA